LRRKKPRPDVTGLRPVGLHRTRQRTNPLGLGAAPLLRQPRGRGWRPATPHTGQRG